MSRAATAIRAERLSKRYTIGKSRAPYQTLRETLAAGFKARGNDAGDESCGR